MMGDLVGVRDYAKRVGLNPSTVTRQLQKGLIPNRGSATRPLIDPDEADAARAGNLDLAKRRKLGPLTGIRSAPLQASESLRPAAAISEDLDDRGAAPSVSDGFMRARTVSETYRARLHKLQFEERVGTLVQAAEVERAQFNAGRVLRDRVLSRVPAQAGKLAVMTDEREIAAFLRAELSDALEKAAVELEAEAAEESAPGGAAEDDGE